MKIKGIEGKFVDVEADEIIDIRNQYKVLQDAYFSILDKNKALETLCREIRKDAHECAQGLEEACLGLIICKIEKALSINQ